jgi:hypothetical protein
MLHLWLKLMRWGMVSGVRCREVSKIVFLKNNVGYKGVNVGFFEITWDFSPLPWDSIFHKRKCPF